MFQQSIYSSISLDSIYCLPTKMRFNYSRPLSFNHMGNYSSQLYKWSCFSTPSLESAPNPLEMDSTNTEVVHQFRFFNVYKDGSLQMFNQIQKTDPILNDPVTGVRSKDVVVSVEPIILGRIFLPKIRDPTQKLPVLYHVHGGGFCFESAFSPRHQKYLTALAVEANCIVFSIEYGMFPDRPIPACYEDSWAGLRWVAAHANGDGHEDWLNKHADFQKIFIGGDSAGGNISHNLAVRVGSDQFIGVKVVGIILIHPYFGGTNDDKMWLYMCPKSMGLNDPRLKPAVADLGTLGCERVLVFVAEKDHLKEVGEGYCRELKKSGWGGSVEILVNEGEEHCFHVEDLTRESSKHLITKVAAFINHG